MKESDEDNIVQMVIDEDKIWAPYKLEAHNNDINNIYSDHNVILLSLNNNKSSGPSDIPIKR